MNSWQPVILIAEDSEMDEALLKRAFRLSGRLTPPHFVSNGEEVIQYLKGEGKFANRAEYPLPDLLLLDLKMPRLNGFEVLEWVRSQPKLQALRIVVLTTTDEMRDVTRAYQLGANSFLTKPLDFEEFRNMLNAVHRYWFGLSRTPTVERPPRVNPFMEEQSPKAEHATTPLAHPRQNRR